MSWVSAADEGRLRPEDGRPSGVIQAIGLRTDNGAMNIRASYFREHTGGMAVLASIAVVLVFILDAITPQNLSIEIAYEVSVGLAALSGSRTLTIRILTLALLGDVFGACADSATGGWHWDDIAVENRIISLMSIFIVGALALSVRSDAAREERNTVRLSQHRRDSALSSAAERFWASLEPGRIEPAIAEEACAVFEAPGALWCPAGSGLLWASSGAGARATSQQQPVPLTEAWDALAMLASVKSVVMVSRSAGIAALTAHLVPQPFYLAVPIAGAENDYGTVLVATQSELADESALATAKEFEVRAIAAMEETLLIETLRQRNAALAERQRVIEDLVDVISHDVRTPLVALSVTLAQALQGAFGSLPEEYTSVLADSRLSIDGIQRLAETLLLVARFEADTPRSRPEPVSLHDLAREIASELSGWADAQGLALRADVPVGATVVGSQSDLRRAISNLLANAIRNTPRGGTIELRVSQQGNAIEIAVRDDGYGVEPSVRPKLFQRFSKAGSEGGGAGLGLYIVRRVAEESGGNVRYEACVPRGSIFTISLPVAAQLAA